MTIRHKLAVLKQHLSHASLASYIGVVARTLGRWLSGANEPLPVFRPIVAGLYDSCLASVRSSSKRRSF